MCIHTYTHIYLYRYLFIYTKRVATQILTAQRLARRASPGAVGADL